MCCLEIQLFCGAVSNHATAALQPVVELACCSCKHEPSIPLEIYISYAMMRLRVQGNVRKENETKSKIPTKVKKHDNTKSPPDPSHYMHNLPQQRLHRLDRDVKMELMNRALEAEAEAAEATKAKEELNAEVLQLAAEEKEARDAANEKKMKLEDAAKRYQLVRKVSCTYSSSATNHWIFQCIAVSAHAQGWSLVHLPFYMQLQAAKQAASQAAGRWEEVLKAVLHDTAELHATDTKEPEHCKEVRHCKRLLQTTVLLQTTHCIPLAFFLVSISRSVKPSGI